MWLAVLLVLAGTAVASPCPASARDNVQKPDHVIALAGIEPGMTVVDVGAGEGYMTCWLGDAVGPRGFVIATEVAPALVAKLGKRIERDGIANAQAILAPANDLGILGHANRVLLVNVWHHLPDRKRYAARIAERLARDGKLVIVDFKPGPGRNGHGITPERVLAELAAGGFDAKLVDEDLPDQYVIIGTIRR